MHYIVQAQNLTIAIAFGIHYLESNLFKLLNKKIFIPIFRCNFTNLSQFHWFDEK